MHPALLLIAILGQSPPLVVTPNWALLTNPTVQSALELSVPQTRAIFAIRSTATAILKRLSRKHSTPPAGEQSGPANPALPALAKFGKALSRSKQARLGQITLQAYGPHVIQAPGVGKALGLSVADVNRITKAQATAAAPYDEKVRLYAVAHPAPTSTVKGAGVVPVETPELRQMYDERDAKQTEVLKQSLTQEQNDRLAKMLGKPVKLN